MEATRSSSSNTGRTTDETLSARFAQEAAELLFAAAGPSHGPSLSHIQSIRAAEARNALSSSDRIKARNKGRKASSCSYCGALRVPGWSGSMRSVTLASGKRNRQRTSTTAKSAFVPKNRLEWTCDGCGFITICAGSDPGTLHRYRKVKSDSAGPAILPASADKVDSAEVPRPKTSILLEARHASDAIPSKASVTLEANKIRRAAKSASPTMKAHPASVSPTPNIVAKTSSLNPVQPHLSIDKKKKRSKKEGLQAMLQARREQEDKEKKTASSFGLSSFLQDLR